MSSNKLQWRIFNNVGGGASKELVAEGDDRYWSQLSRVVCKGVKWVLRGAGRFMERAWDVGAAEPRRLIHGVKVGMALSLVSLFYYMRPLYEGVGGNGMWAIMTVVVVFEYTVGATLSKSINRATGTFLAGSLGVGVHWVANQSGDDMEPIVTGISVFLLASAATFSRFVPTVKARFDYGALIFILTFSLVSVSGYRVDKLIDMAHERLSTIVIGTSLCIMTSMLVCPVWAGNELHNLTHRNLDKLASSLEGCISYYYRGNQDGDGGEEESNFKKKIQAYKCVLNTKTTEESMANFARWEPAHGRFGFRHPWKEYLKIGALMRNCAYCIETMTACINPEIQAPEHLQIHLRKECTALCSHLSSVLKELALTVKTMTKSSKLDFSIGEMNFAVQELQDALRSLPSHPNPATLANHELPPASTDDNNNNRSVVAASHGPVLLLEVLPLVTLVSLLIETAARIEDLADGVVELSEKAEFKPPTEDKLPKQDQNIISNNHHTIEIPDQYDAVKARAPQIA